MISGDRPNCSGSCNAEEFPSGDTPAALDFLHHWEPTGPWLLTAIIPDGSIETRTFHGDQESQAFAWIDLCQGKRNLYFSVNQPKCDLESKARKADIGWINALHVDVDPEDGADLESERQRIIGMLRDFIPPPSVIISSGGGAQGFWLLKKPGAVDAPLPYEEINKRLAAALGGDHCYNIDRIMRLPGTINIPDQKKRAKGRRRAQAMLVDADWSRRYTLDDFEALPRGPDPKNDGPAPGAANINALPIPKRIKNLIHGIDDPDHPYASRSEAVYAVLVAMAASGCTDAQVRAVLSDPRFPISAHVLEQPKPDEYLARQISRARAATIDPDVAKVNENYALVLVGDKTVILKQGVSSEGRPDFCLMTTSSFEQWFGNRFVERPGQKKPVPLGRYWLSHPQRRQYEGIVFAPGRDVQGFFNLWRGFAVEPRPGDCSLFLAHLKENVCRGDDALFTWVVGWIAAIFQRPDRKDGVSLVIRGKEGTGKTKIGEVIGWLLGDHYVAISDPRYITGRFNSHLAACLLLHADEAFWAGDHAAEGRLKDLITGTHHLIEFKGREPVRVNNFIRLFVTGNPEWVAPVSMDGRRFAVFEIGENHKEDTAYFAAIDDEMDHGGREALLYHLLNYDLRQVDLRHIPKTAALLDQKMASMLPHQGWLLDVLNSGRLPRGCGVPGECPAAYFFDHYVDHANKAGARRRAIETQIGTFLQRAVPGLRKRQGSYINSQGGAERGSIYEFPDLDTCRKAFASLFQQEFPWGDPVNWLAEDEPEEEGCDGPPF